MPDSSFFPFTPGVNRMERTPESVQVYTLLSADPPPVSLDDMKEYLRITGTSDDALITAMLGAATEWGEKYTGRDFRVKVWRLVLDVFQQNIVLRRDPVDVEILPTVEHIVNGTFVTVDNSLYYAIKNVQTSEVVLFENEEWPDNTDDRLHAIRVDFTTMSYFCTAEIAQALKMMVAFWFENRGDCPVDADSANEMAVRSGATMIFNQFRISRL